MKIALGTAQFGLNYGISNTLGQVKKDEIKRILSAALDAGITVVDTASAYGISESNIGQSGLSQALSIVTKVSSENIHAQVEKSLKNLNCDSIDAVLFHNCELLLSCSGEDYFSQLEQLKTKGIVKRIGVSVYNPKELELLSERFNLDLIQAPVNWLDQRFIQPEIIDKLIEKNIKLHARSIFLQGLLLEPMIQNNAYFSQFNNEFSQYNRVINELGCNRLTFALAIIAQKAPHIENAIIGCCSQEQLTQLIDSYCAAKKLTLPSDDVLASLASSNLALINPSQWLG
ncbi:aldo/keto reductase [Pseudoalteromonas sp. MQS005]|uniref:aldo/keto reductase n=1 Tax=Pseudoalteromonas sp. MQS005 TaxID=1854052 RepID=UPI0007E4FFD3|nr:aldo/keto reductase [Pseudoalteromonas sp. MQS005]